MSKATYQPEIDGLRAIAVLSVFIFHINELYLPGGFVGVDIFFVLSGFLITGNIYTQIQENSFSFKDFYNRRIKRLLPSLYLVLFTSCFLAALVLLPDDLKSFNDSLKYIVFFLSNHFFSKGISYFSPLVNETPLLHTWSLAIEEQFYFIFPLLAVLFTYLKLSRKKTLVLLGFACLFSISYASFLIFKKDQTFAYYAFLPRFGELLIGSLLAISKFKIRKNAAASTMLGLALIFLSFVVINHTTHFPGFMSLLPCIGTLLVLASEKNTAFKLLQTSPFVYIGKISYQVYLWHWVLLAFVRYCTGSYSLSTANTVLVVIATFIFSVLASKFIENPIRYSRLSFGKTVSYFFILPTITILLFIYASPVFYFKTKQFTSEDFTSYGTKICHGTKETADCLKGSGTAPKFLVVGDSHAAHLNMFFDRLGKDQDWSAMVMTASSCSPILELDESIMSVASDRDNCNALKNYFKEQTHLYKNIIIASRWDYQIGLTKGEKSDPKYVEKFENTLSWLKSLNKNVYVISQIPLLSLSPQRAELLASRFKVSPSQNSSETVNQANAIIKAVTAKFPNTTWVDISGPFANFESGIYFENKIMYKDNNHLNIYGADMLAQILMKDHAFTVFQQAP